MKDVAQEWICCQLGAREHYAVARALHRQGALHLLITDVWVRPNGVFAKFHSRLRGRFHIELSTANVYAPHCSNILFELQAKLSRLRDWQLIVARNKWFQNIAVQRLSQMPFGSSPRTVVAYSYAALEILKFARSRGWRTILAQIDPGPQEDRVVAKLYDEDPLYAGQFTRPPQEYWSTWLEECAFADRIVVNSKWSQRALVQEGVAADKVKIVPLAYDSDRDPGARPREYPSVFTSARPLRVLFLGQINLRKGVGPLLNAIRLLQQEPIEFTFVGPIQIPIPVEFRNNLKVHWVGSVTREDTAKFYQDADLFVFPTVSDGFGLTQLEARAWRLPIIASRFCGDVVEDGRNGLVLSDVTPGAIAAAIRRCCAEPELLQSFSSRSILAKRFGLNYIGEQWLSVFE
jgi:glycosyltransferase involved in cell wall biosynthesis